MSPLMLGFLIFLRLQIKNNLCIEETLHQYPSFTKSVFIHGNKVNILLHCSSLTMTEFHIIRAFYLEILFGFIDQMIDSKI